MLASDNPGDSHPGQAWAGWMRLNRWAEAQGTVFSQLRTQGHLPEQCRVWQGQDLIWRTPGCWGHAQGFRAPVRSAMPRLVVIPGMMMKARFWSLAELGLNQILQSMWDPGQVV